MNDILTVAAVVALVGAALTLVLVRGRDFATYAPAVREPDRAVAAA